MMTMILIHLLDQALDELKTKVLKRHKLEMTESKAKY
jgi:hypothetical protein